jgi:heat shock protein HtpX
MLYLLYIAIIIGAEYGISVLTNAPGFFLVMLGIHLFFGLLSLSPLGDFVLRLSAGVRPFMSEEEQVMAYNIIDEVYKAAATDFPDIDEDIRFFMDDSMAINAYAMGNRTIVFTKGLFMLMDEEELKGITAHEMGHLVNGDTKIALIVVTSSTIFRLMVAFFLKIIGLVISGVVKKLMREALFMDKLIPSLFKGGQYFFFGLDIIGSLILARNSRGNEFRADKYAFQLGFGEGLKSALMKFNDMNFSSLSFLERLLSSHPHLSERIARLEQGEFGEDEPTVITRLMEFLKDMFGSEEEPAPPNFFNASSRMPITEESDAPIYSQNTMWGIPLAEQAEQYPAGEEEKPREENTRNHRRLKVGRVSVLSDGRWFYVFKHKVYKGNHYYLVSFFEGANLSKEREIIKEVSAGGERHIIKDNSPEIRGIMGIQ